MMEMEIKTAEALQDASGRMERFLMEKSVSPERIFDCRLVVNELIGNVFRHSCGVARLRIQIKDGFVEVRVFSSVEYLPPLESNCSEVYAENGRGLYLVDCICHERAYANGEILVRIKML